MANTIKILRLKAMIVLTPLHFIGPADCDRCKCSHILFSEPSKTANCCTGFKQFVVTISVVTVCWSYGHLLSVLGGAQTMVAQTRQPFLYKE